MMPEEWPIAASAADREGPARAGGRSRLATVRVDFFLDPAERLTEQERALMTAMLGCLISDIADELRAALPAGRMPANDTEDAALLESLKAARLLDEPGLMALLLRRADEERIGIAARARAGRREARTLQGLVSHGEAAVSAAAMALILARGRRRDRFGQCLVACDDLPPESAQALVHAVAAGLRSRAASPGPGGRLDRELHSAATALIERCEPERSVDWLTADLVRRLEESDAIDDELVTAAAHEGEIGFVAQVVATRSGIAASDVLDELMSGDRRRVVAMLRLGRFSRGLAAGILAGIGDLLRIADPADAIAQFDSLGAEELESIAALLVTSRGYRCALAALGTGQDG